MLPEIERLVIADQTGGITPTDVIRFGYAIAEVPGYEPPPPEHDSIREAEKQRNSLPPEARTALNRNAAQVGYRSPSGSFEG